MTTFKMKTVHLKHFKNAYHDQGISCTVTLLMQYFCGSLHKIDQKQGLVGRVPVIVYCTLKLGGCHTTKIVYIVEDLQPLFDKVFDN